MNFREHIRARARAATSVLEIGPSYNPIAPRGEGFRVTTFDHVSKADLIEKYRGHPVDASRIEDVDVVGTDLSVFAGRGFDCIIASHVIEHAPDLLAFLQHCATALAPGGQLFLVVPDRRFCFDYRRPWSTTGQVLDAHLSKKTRHLGAVFDQHAWAVSKNGSIVWGEGNTAPLAPVHDFEFASSAFRQAVASTEYTDAHEWVFTPSSFRIICHDLSKLDYLPFGEATFHDSIGCEFFLVLVKDAKTWPARASMIESLEKELAPLATPPAPAPTGDLASVERELRALISKRLPVARRLKAAVDRLRRG